MATTFGIFNIDEVDMDTVLKRYELPYREAYNLHARATFRAAFCTDIDEGYYKFATTAFKMQELGPMARPDPQQQVWGRKQKDVRKFGNGFAYTYEWLARTRSTKDIQEAQKRCFQADENLVNALVIDMLLASNTHYGLINTLYGLAEPLSAPPPYGQNAFTAAHTHYTTTGTAALSTLTPITAATEHLAEHGHSGPYMALINSHNVMDIENMAAWNAAATTPVPNPILDRVAVNGFRGRMLGIDWFETEWVPADYIIVISTPDASELVGFVQFENPNAQGLVLFNDSIPLTRENLNQVPVGSYPLTNTYYIRWCNTYVLLRTAAVVIQVTTGSYSRPSVTGVAISTPAAR